jgi:Lysine-specific metallo-endopeptidase
MYNRFVDEVFDGLAEEYDAGYDERLDADLDFKRDRFDEYFDEVLDEALSESESIALVTNVPTPGRFYDIQPGQGGLLITAGRAYGGSGPERLLRAQQINNHPLNRKFWRSPSGSFERAYFSGGIISFNRKFTCGVEQRRAIGGERQCYARIWIPPARGGWPPDYIEPPAEPKRPYIEPPAEPKKPPKPEPPRPEGPLPRIINCNTRVWGNVASYWREAVNRVARANQRLNSLAKMTQSRRQGAWQDLEETWFGQYDERRFRTVREGMLKIGIRLKDPRLKINCSRAFRGLLGGALAPRTILLYAGWRDLRSGDIDKVETIIHEAAHLTGVGRIIERAGYYQAQDRAKTHPDRAVRRADNYGYYAMEVP